MKSTIRQFLGFSVGVTFLFFMGELGCNKAQDFSLRIKLGVSSDDAEWLEVVAYPDTLCENVFRRGLAGGLPNQTEGGTPRRVIYDLYNPKAPRPPIGQVDRKWVAIAAVTKTGDCEVVASACSDVNTYEKDSATLSLIRVEPAVDGQCDLGSKRCVDGRCTSAKNAKTQLGLPLHTDEVGDADEIQRAQSSLTEEKDLSSVGKEFSIQIEP